MTLRFPTARGLAAAPHVCVARCCLGMTLYTRHRPPTPSIGVAELLRAFLATDAARRARLLRTSLMSDWIALGPETVEDVIAHVANDGLTGRVRHLFSFHLASAADAPEVFFEYREIDEARGSAGYVQLGMPCDTAPAVLWRLARLAAERVPMWSGAAGYLGSVHPRELAAGHGVFAEWAKRYWGLDVQDPERARLHAHEGVPSVSWLTFLGADLLDPADFADLRRAAAVYPSIEWTPGREATTVRAGDEPTLADAHAMQVGASLGKAHALLARLLPRDPVRLYGGFWEGDASKRWSRRFLEPEGWS